VSEELPGDTGRQLAGFAPGSLVAGYRLEDRIGAGGMAVVFRARDERLGRLVALKILAPALAADAAFRQRFIRESRMAAAVDDPHIIPVFEAGEAGGVLFIAMRFVRGGDVRSLLHREGPMPAARVAAIVSPVASALDAAHAAGLVHRDVKPANMLVDERSDRPDHVYLSDFGLSKGALPSAELTRSGQYLGTAAYSAPEQIEGRTVDGRTDQYALACAAFEMLSGEAPFLRDQELAVIWAHLSQPPPSLTALRPDLPAAVNQVFGRALAKSPGDRYATCREFADALRAALGVDPYLAGHGGAAAGGPAREHARPAGPGAADAAIPADAAAARAAGSPAGDRGQPAWPQDAPAWQPDAAAWQPGPPAGQPGPQAWPQDAHAGPPNQPAGQPGPPAWQQDAPAGPLSPPAGQPGPQTWQPGPGGQPGMPAWQQGAPAGQQGAPGGPQGMAAGPPGAPAWPQGAPAGQVGPQAWQQDAPAGQPAPQAWQQGQQAWQPGPGGQPGMPAWQQGSPAGHQGAPAGQPGPQAWPQDAHAWQQGAPAWQPDTVGWQPGSPAGPPGPQAWQPGAANWQPGGPAWQPGAATWGAGLPADAVTAPGRASRRPILIAVGAVVVVVAIVVTVVVIKLSPGSPVRAASHYPKGALPPNVMAEITGVPVGTLDAVGSGSAFSYDPTGLKTVSGSALTSGGKPEMLYIGAEWCDLCGTMRWAVAVALSRFGSLSPVDGIFSGSSGETYPHTPSITFYRSTYSSPYMAFAPVENQTVTKVELQVPTPEQQALWDRYDQGSYPFIDIGNKYVITSALYSPSVLAGMTWAGVAAALRDPASPVAQGVDGAANVITAAICVLTRNQPSSVCASPMITGLEPKL
jgi:Protein kinase domain/Domain of unknown function (DUF929)